MNKQNVKRKWASLGTIIGVATVSFLLYTSVFMNIEVKDEPGWHIVWEGSLAEAAEGDPGSGVSGFLEIFFVNHTDTESIYARNDSSTFETWANAALAAGGGNAWANDDLFNLQLKHSTSFNIVVRCRFNRTVAFNGTMFRDADCRVNLTAAGGGITISDVTGTNEVSQNVTTNEYIWINVVWDNSNAGYSLGKGQTCDITEISIEAKY